MKKLVTAFAACALAGAVFAQVESVNIVGYSTASLAAGYNMIGVNFEAVGATDGKVSGTLGARHRAQGHPPAAGEDECAVRRGDTTL